MTESRNSGRDLAVLIGGVAAGFVASRLLPPLIAAAAGSRRVSDPFELLIADHRKIAATLDQMVQHSSGSAARRGALFLTLKRKLAKHALAEEDVVYPILHGEGQESTRSKHLYDEHADMKIHLYELEQKLMAGEDWGDSVRRLRDLILRHIDEEEREVFPRMRGMLDERRRSGVSGLISREEALVL